MTYTINLEKKKEFEKCQLKINMKNIIIFDIMHLCSIYYFPLYSF